MSDWLGKLKSEAASRGLGGEDKGCPPGPDEGGEPGDEGVAEVQPPCDPLHPDLPQAGQHLQQGSD